MPQANPILDAEELLKQLTPVLDEKSLKEMQTRMEQARKDMERAMQQMQQQRGWFPMIQRLPRTAGADWVGWMCLA